MVEYRAFDLDYPDQKRADWLAERVGESRDVVATDIDVTYLERLDLPNLEVRPL